MTHKIVEAIGTIAGSSLEQTTWLRRNLEVKASPQIVVDGTNLEADVEGLQLVTTGRYECCTEGCACADIPVLYLHHTVSNLSLLRCMNRLKVERRGMALL